MLNYDGKVGAVGRIPSYMRGIVTTRIVKFDIEHEMPVRGADGFCIECADGEAGEAIGMIADEPGKTFDGYTKEADTQKKILHDVFEKGDAWFRTGDLMRRDAHGYFYFVDRIGDTFRWKGENVATSEVAEALASFPGVKEANVYGVGVAGHGRTRRAWRRWLSAPGSRSSMARREHWPATCRPMRGRFSCACSPRWRSPAPSSSARSNW